MHHSASRFICDMSTCGQPTDAGPFVSIDSNALDPLDSTASSGLDSTVGSGRRRVLPGMGAIDRTGGSDCGRHDESAGNGVHHRRCPWRYREPGGRDDQVTGVAGEVAVTTPAEPPPLTPPAARALPRILTKAAPTGKAPP